MALASFPARQGQQRSLRRNWGPGHVEEWTLSLAAERHLAPSTIRGYQTDLRLFSEYLSDGRYGWAAECEKAFGPRVHPVPVCHEWNTIAHLTEDGVDRRFIQESASHRCDTSTAIYMSAGIS